jgi:hypothetical protein
MNVAATAARAAANQMGRIAMISAEWSSGVRQGIRRSLWVTATVAGVLAVCAVSALGAPNKSSDPLVDGFREPPNSARPQVWWHWMNGNVTKEGIAADLAWLQRIGIGGVQNFDVNLGTPQVVSQRLEYMSAPWRDAFRFALETAAEKGLQFTIASSPGWSETGGPWVTPDDAMKKLVWSEVSAIGGRRIVASLPVPPSTTGPFLDAVFHDPIAADDAAPPAPPHYGDIAVLAFPDPSAPALPTPKAISTGGKSLDALALTDNRLSTEVTVPRGEGGAAEVRLTYPRPVTVRSATVFLPGAVTPFGPPLVQLVLEVHHARLWRRVAELPIQAVPTTSAFAPVTAQEFRLVLVPSTGKAPLDLGAPAPGAITFDFPPKAPANAPIRLAMLRLSASPFIAQFELKAGYGVAMDYFALDPPGLSETVGVAPGQVVDLTSRLRADGTLDWIPPPGRWKVLRLGWSLTGTINHPAPAESTGLEVDKYDGAAVRRYLQHYLATYESAVGPDRLGPRGISSLLNDSTEVGPSNWTPKLLERFRTMRGYDPRPWLPTLTGTIVGSRKQSDAFLYDFRRTLAELHAAEHYGTVAAVAHEHGMKVYGEALESVRPTLGDDLAMRAYTDVPMAALWTFDRTTGPRSTLLGDLKGASSVAHVYGQNIAAAESLTTAFAPYAFAPADLRRCIDLEFLFGINRPVIHTSVHQPVDDKLPGLSLAIFGQDFHRHATWAELARPWIDYIARSSFLLQQGRDAADVAYFYGEEGPLTALFADAPLSDTPVRYAYDFVNADILAHEVSVENGELVTRGGAHYRALYLGGSSRRMTIGTLKRLRELVVAGATLIGERPQSSPALMDDPDEFRRLVATLWNGAGRRTVGRGVVIAATRIEEALESSGIPADFEYSASDTRQPAPKVLFVHRKLADGDIYFVDNREARAVTLDARFRVSGRAPEIWRADRKSIEPVSYRIESGRTTVPLSLESDESLFVVFRRATTVTAEQVPSSDVQSAGDLTGPWTVEFQPGRGAPASTVLGPLAPLNENPEAGIRYFSGVASYRTTFMRKESLAPGQSLILDLGRIGDVAEVIVNGRSAGITWWPPYQVDITQVAQDGENRLEVRIANLWVNRLIGDAQPGVTPLTFSNMPTYRPDAPLRPSGLLGPVQLLTTREMRP